ncbi:phosphonate ABC transporter ATP-binding protein [Fenollaria sporofastidiosus]|uniref:phosphonate ABC transporter ATP-binding protein n=1 Tax=Fenollaria sporofastidiosus TaxID=2811778 RepID=UPI001C002FC5|nr:phosphonate ABC transporter ATP-binding protein [Fenollaria sporofastidiosus]
MILEVKDISVQYEKNIDAIKDVSFDVEGGDFVALIGPSGAGKSTLLKAINALNPLSKGSVIYKGEDVHSLGAKDLRKLRRNIAFIFQDTSIIENISVLDNVLLARLGEKKFFEAMLSKYTDEEYDSALKAIEMVGLKEKTYALAKDLSGGQKQRVAIARALFQKSDLILADEPISSLDIETKRSIMDIFKMLNNDYKKIIVISMHDLDLSLEYAKRVIAIKDHRVYFDRSVSELDYDRVKDLFI